MDPQAARRVSCASYSHDHPLTMRHFTLFASLLALPLLASAQPPCSGYPLEITGQPQPGNAAVFWASSQPQAMNYVWSFGDGSTGSGTQVSHAYNAPGLYAVCVSAFWWSPNTLDSCWAETCITYAVGGSQPCDSAVVDFGWNAGANGTVFFNGTSNIPGANYFWQFGDGQVGGGQQTTHTYAQPGQYEVCVDASRFDPQTQDSCWAKHCEWIVVSGPAPCDSVEACFVSTLLSNGAYFFDNCSSFQNNAQFFWNFGDGTTAQGVNADHHYQLPGTYTVCLTMVHGNCADSTCTTVIVAGGGSPCDSLWTSFTWNATSGSTAVFHGTASQPNTSLIWQFGDGSTGFGPVATHTYPAAGQYQVCLVGWAWDPADQDTCITESCQWITVGGGTPCDSLQACFVPNDMGNGTFFFDNCSWIPGVSANFHWNFGDGTTSSVTNAEHHYTAPGTYTVCLTATFGNCVDSTCTTIIVQGTNPCDVLDACFTAQDLGNGMYFFQQCLLIPNAQYLWNFGDGTSGTGPNMDHLYPGPGVYNACLTVFLGNCVDTACTTIVVHGGPSPCDSLSASFDWQPASGNTAVFHGTATLPNTSLVWQFGDGTTGQGPSVTHTYPAPGQYYVCLWAWAWNSAGQDTCAFETCQWITVGGGGPSCEGFDADFTWNDGGNGTMFFQGMSTHSATAMIWNFGDGSVGAGDDPVHVYEEPGDYLVCLSAWAWDPMTQDSCVADTCHFVHVSGTGPCNGLSACFVTNDLGSGNFFFDNCSWIPGVGANFHWNFGDGSTSTVTNAEHHYQAPGTYTVCLVASIGNCVDSTCTTIVVGNGGGCDGFETDFTWNSGGGNTMFFNSMSTQPVWAMQWSFGDGTTGDGASPVHTYAQPGEYLVCLSAWSWNLLTQDSCYSDTCHWVMVGGGTPCDSLQACFVTNDLGNGGFFFDNCTWMSGLVTGYLWNFGDGTTSTVVNAEHHYTAPGTYTVCLTATYGNCTDMTCNMVVVEGGDPCSGLEACFQANPFENGAYWFDNCSSHQDNATFHWSFGDGSTSTELSPDHHYAQPGLYTVCLIAVLENCVDSTCTTILVTGGTPCDAFQATFTWNVEGPPNAVVFHGSTSVPAAAMYWYFGDGSTGVGPDVAHTYDEPGEYQVCLSALRLMEGTADSCWSDVCQWITVGGGGPCSGFNACFVPNDLGNGNFFFDNCSSNQGANTDFVWNFGDGTSSTDTHGMHHYSAPGTYTVCLMATLENCFDSTCTTIVVGGGGPCDSFTLDFSWNNAGSNQVSFNGTSSIPGAIYTWQFGDGTFDDSPNPTHTYAQPGEYQVCLSGWVWNLLNQDSCYTETCQWIVVGDSTGGNCDAFTAWFEVSSQGTNSVFTGHTSLPADGAWWSFGDGTTGTGLNATHLYEPPGPFEVCLHAWRWDAATQDSCYTQYCQWVNPFGTTGVGSVDGADAFRVFPNPAHNLLNIDGPAITGEAHVRLFGMDGRLELQERVSAWPVRMDVSNLAPAVHLVELDVDGQRYHYRVVVE